MAKRVFTDFAGTTLSASIGSGATSCTLVAMSSSGPPPYTFPAYVAGSQFVASLIDASTGTQIEEVLVTAWDVGTNTISTMTRGYNGTAAKAYLAGDKFELLWTSDAGNNAAYVDQANTFTQPQVVGAAVAGTQAITAAQVQNNPTYADDTGVVNAYVIALAIPVLALVDGQRYSMSTLNANTSTTPTLKINALVAKTIVNFDGSALAVGQILANTPVEFTYNSSIDKFMIQSVSTAYTGTLLRETAYTTAGTFTWNRGASTRKVKVTVKGGGGSGGSGVAGTSVGGGGGEGGIAIGLYDVTALASASVTIALGSTSSFGILASATAGAAAVGSIQGAGGTGTGGDINLTGQAGGAGNTGNAATAAATGGGSGGGNGGGAGGQAANLTAQAGQAGANGGGGGGGTGTNAGGAGSVGYVIVEEYA